MRPTTSAAATLLALPAAALGQGFSRPPGLSPTVTPGMIRPAAWAAPFGPGGVYTTRGYPGAGPLLAPSYLGGYGYGGYSYGGYGYDFNPYYPGPVAYVASWPTAAPLVGAPGFLRDGPSPDAPLTAELGLEFPADATITVDGKPQPGAGAAHTLTTRPLKPGETATLAVTATWTANGERHEWTRAVTLGRGERGRLTVVGGAKVK